MDATQTKTPRLKKREKDRPVGKSRITGGEERFGLGEEGKTLRDGGKKGTYLRFDRGGRSLLELGQEKGKRSIRSALEKKERETAGSKLIVGKKRYFSIIGKKKVPRKETGKKKGKGRPYICRGKKRVVAPQGTFPPGVALSAGPKR